jgi:hypothetical protein
MLARIQERGGGVFSAADFLDLGLQSAVDAALSRMVAAQTIRRVARGWYEIPHLHPVAGLTFPDIQNAAEALAGNPGTLVPPAGACTANMPGWPDSFSIKVAFSPAGRSQRVRIGKPDISLKKSRH